MCGLVGIAGDVNYKGEKIFTNMFLLNVMRGAHGCGVLKVDEDKKGVWYSQHFSEKPSSAYVFEKDYKDILSSNNISILMGHSRHATVGGINIENNHPFDTGGDNPIIGMHNGTIRGNFTGSNNYGTDSEALYNLIAEKGLKPALTEVHEKCHSVAYALAFYKPEDNSVSLIRNDQRPLYLCRWNGNYLWSSDPSFIRFSMSREGVDPKDYEIQSIEPGTLVKIFSYKSGKERLKVIPGYFKPPVFRNYTSYGTRGAHQSDLWEDAPWGTRFYGSGPRKTVKAPEQKIKVHFMIGQKEYSATEYVHHLNQRCAYCDNVPFMKDEVRFEPNNHNTFYCAQCKEGIKDLQIDWDNLEVVSKIETRLN